MKKIGRNDPCPCGSGKKFKKCCESTMIGGRYKATKIDSTNSSQIAKSTVLTGFFHSHVSSVKPEDSHRQIKVTKPPENPSVPEPNSEESEGNS